MVGLNNYKKVQIVLLIFIAIAGIAFAITLFKTQETKELSTRETSIGAVESIEEEEEEEQLEEEIEEIEEVEGDTSWDEENVEDTKVDMEKENKKEENNKGQYYIKVNYTANCVTVYKKDDSGNYTIPVKALICSTGTATPTSGVYKTSNKYRWHQLNGGVYGQYCTRITGHILFHSVPCSSQSPDSLKYTAYDKLGTRASAGCVRLTVEGAMWIYNNCASGTYVEFYSSSNPGPLGKPSAKKISSNVQCRNWDPTDPDPRNPWRTYVEPEITQPVQQQQEVTKPEVAPAVQEPQVQPEPPQPPQQPQQQEEPNQNNNNNNNDNGNNDNNNDNNSDQPQDENNTEPGNGNTGGGTDTENQGDSGSNGNDDTGESNND